MAAGRSGKESTDVATNDEEGVEAAIDGGGLKWCAGWAGSVRVTPGFTGFRS